MAPENTDKAAQEIRIRKNGPYVVSGNVPLARESIRSDEEASSVGWQAEESYPRQEEYHLCRCGRSESKPFCDETHQMVDFDGTETASEDRYLDRAEVLEGPRLRLTDREDLCAIARFCHAKGGAWDIARTANTDREVRDAAEVACNCPAGRLVVWDKGTGRPIEPDYPRSISVTEYPLEDVSGPLWVKGGIPVVSSEGREYEVRNRQTLCRCGASRNKPFCDGSHIEVGFSDGTVPRER